MQGNPKVSIIIPVFNGSNYLRDAIDSALAQSYRNIEVIVVNDGSNDNGKTEKIALSYGDAIRYVTKENGGVASALNRGIREMTGEYFSWLSHDDIFYQHKIEAQISFLRTRPHDVILYSNYDLIDADGNVTGSERTGHIEPEQIRYFLTVSHPIHGCTTLIPKQCFQACGLFNESLLTTQDYDMWFRLAAKYSFIHMEGCLIQSRVHAEQGTLSMKPLHVREVNALLAEFVSSLHPDEIVAATGESLGLSYAKIAFNFSKRGFYSAASAALVQSSKHLGDLKLSERVMGWLLLSALYLSRNMRMTELVLMSERIWSRLFGKNNLKDQFTEIYQKNIWKGRESKSGEGSSLAQTEAIRREIPRLLHDFQIKALLDAPCGDFHWFSRADILVEKYIGIDIVDDLITLNRQKYANPQRDFLCMNIVTDTLPQADLILSRDCLVHLSNAQALAVIRNFKRSGATFMLTTTFIDRSENRDLAGKQTWRPLNLMLPPFNLCAPLRVINENCTEEDGAYRDKCLGLWELSHIDL
jgi:hypothetical protein